MALHVETPLLKAPPELFGPGRTVWLKMDALQPSGSFKMRGVGRLVQQRVADGARAVVCASGGNAGMAAALAALACGVPATIVVPETTGAPVRAAIAARGATVVVHGASWDDANAHASALTAQLGAVYVHPFDDPLLWDGHATLSTQGLPSTAAISGVEKDLLAAPPLVMTLERFVPQAISPVAVFNAAMKRTSTPSQ